MGGAPGPVKCCMFRLKTPNKQIFIIVAKCYLETHRQIHLNKLHQILYSLWKFTVKFYC